MSRVEAEFGNIERFDLEMFSYFKYITNNFDFFSINTNIKRRTLFSEKESKKNIKIRDYTKVVKKTLLMKKALKL